MPYIFLNNKIVNEEDAVISVNDRGFLYGDGIFETLRSYDGFVFNLDKHVERMRSSSAVLKMPFVRSCDEISTIIDELLKKNSLRDAYIRITLSRGIGNVDGGFRIAGNTSFVNRRSFVQNSTFVIQVRALRPRDDKLYSRGVSAVISKSRISASCPTKRHKTSNFLANIIARDEADMKGAHEAILMDTDSFVAECSASNLFIVEGDMVITPPVSTNILPGITRETVIDICRGNSIQISEERFCAERLMNADECFITNSLIEIMPVADIDGIKLRGSLPGLKTTQLASAYNAMAHP